VFFVNCLYRHLKFIFQHLKFRIFFVLNENGSIINTKLLFPLFSEEIPLLAMHLTFFNVTV